MKKQLKPFVVTIEDRAIPDWETEVYVIAKSREEALGLAAQDLEPGYHPTSALTSEESPEHAQRMSTLDTECTAIHDRGLGLHLPTRRRMGKRLIGFGTAMLA
ncbi:MAG: hypothetical protein ACO1QS_09325 [Verrucomicrobiota bacterium]